MLSQISTLKALDCVLALSNIVEETGRSPLLFLGEAGGAGGKAPCISSRLSQTSVDGLGGIIGRRKRAVDALASTVPFFGVADRLPRGGLSRGTWNSGLSEAREHMP